MLTIVDVVGQTAHVREEYVIAVIQPGLLGGGDGKCRVIFVGGVIEVTQVEAQRVVAACERPLTQDAALRAGIAAVAT